MNDYQLLSENLTETIINKTYLDTQAIIDTFTETLEQYGATAMNLKMAIDLLNYAIKEMPEHE